MSGLTRRDAFKISAASLAILKIANEAQAQAVPPLASKTWDVVFEGGGIKAAALAGALRTLEARGYGFRRIIGTSAGAIAATFLAAGFKSSQLLELLTEQQDGHHRFRTFLQPPTKIPVPEPHTASFVKDSIIKKAVQQPWDAFCQVLRGACKPFAVLDKQFPRYSQENMTNHVNQGLSLLSLGATASDAPFLKWMEEGLKKAGIDEPEMTLASFHAHTKAHGIQLSLVATDVTARRSLVLNHLTAPDLPVRWAVRMSMGIPLVWPEVEWQSKWGHYRGAPMWTELGGNKIVDGGVLSNFPLRFLLDPRHTTSTGVLGPLPNDKEIPAVGLLLDETLEPPGEAMAVHEQRLKFAQKVAAYQSMSRLLDTLTGAWDQDAIDQYGAEKKICRIGVKGFDTLDFDMEKARMDQLVASGQTAMEGYLKSIG